MPTSTLVIFMGSQSKAKTIFLLISMVGWLIVGAVLMYLFPLMANFFTHSETTELWVSNLTKWGYQPRMASTVGGAALLLTTAGNLIWYRQFEGKL